MLTKISYEVTFVNKGGLVTPLLIEWTYEDGSKEVEKYLQKYGDIMKRR